MFCKCKTSVLRLYIQEGETAPEKSIMKKLAMTTAVLFMLVTGAFGVTIEAAAPVSTSQPQQSEERYVIASSEKVTSRVTVLISGASTPTAFYGEIINSTTYAPVLDFAVAMGAASVIRAENTVSVVATGLVLSATAGDLYIEANGRYLYVPELCLLIDDVVCAPVRILAEAFGATVDWSGDLMLAQVTPGITPVSSELPYSDEDLYWMSRIITAEARGECFDGQIAVGNVIMNRIASDSFPDTVHDVVFDGYQFTPAVTGAIYNTPTDQCILAAKLALEGVRTVGDSLYFSATTKCWADNNRAFTGAIGGHYFYA